MGSSEMTPEELFKKYDKNDNGTIDKSEIKKMLTKQVEDRVEAIFKNPDFNPDKDNKIKKAGKVDTTWTDHKLWQFAGFYYLSMS